MSIDRVHEDHKIQKLEDASVSLCLGALLLVVSGVAGIFTFAAIRSGTPFWLEYTGTLGGLGLIFSAIGIIGRSANS